MPHGTIECEETEEPDSAAIACYAAPSAPRSNEGTRLHPIPRSRVVRSVSARGAACSYLGEGAQWPGNVVGIFGSMAHAGRKAHELQCFRKVSYNPPDPVRIFLLQPIQILAIH